MPDGPGRLESFFMHVISCFNARKLGGHATFVTRVKIVCRALVSTGLLISVGVGVGVGVGVSSTISTVVLPNPTSTTQTGRVALED